MSKKHVILLAACALCLLALTAALVRQGSLAAPAEPTAGYAIPWWTVDSGGGTSQGGSYTLSGTAGQADAGTLSSGSFSIKGGFMGGSVSYVTYLPILTHQ